MAVPKSIREAKGLWQGKSQLNLPFLPPEKRVSESNSRFHIETDDQNSYATITYDWHYEGKRQEGTIIVCMAEKSRAVQFGWVDSWHQSTAVMHLTGKESDSGSVKVKGTYPAGKETWGWTIEFIHEGDGISMNMENVTPSGEAIWAVKATYKRA